MSFPHLLCALLWMACFALATVWEPWHREWQGNRRGGTLSLMIGDSRRLFANHVYAKADAYFHGGYYPTIFDKPVQEPQKHMEAASKGTGHVCNDPDHDHDHEAHDGEHHDCFDISKPLDVLDAFGRHFYPSRHFHIEMTDQREILPWLRLTAELDPHKIETYTVAAYNLRKFLGKSAGAEQFLREGLRANPDSFEILFEMGRIRQEDRNDLTGAGNLWELALKKWRAAKLHQEAPDELYLMHILGFLARLEEQRGNLAKAVEYLDQLKDVSPSRGELEKQIRELKARQTAP